MENFSDFVKNENDFEGLIAYSLYVQEKKNTVASYKLKNSSNPDPAYINAMYDGEGRIVAYREKAQLKIQNYLLTVYAFEEKKRREKIGAGYLHGIFQNILANIIWIMLLVLISIVNKDRIEEWFKSTLTSSIPKAATGQHQENGSPNGG